MAIAFSDTTNKNGIIQRCEILCALGDTGISGNSTLLKQFTGIINSWYQKVVTMILASTNDWDWDDIGTTDGSTPTNTNYPIATFPLVALQRDYPLGAAAKLLKLKRVDITYDGTNWSRVTPFDSGSFTDSSNVGFGNDTIIDADDFSDITHPFYDIKAQSLFIYPMATSSQVSAGAKARIEFTREPSEFASSDTTKTLGIDAAFQPMIPIGASYEWCSINAPSIAQALMPMLTDYEARLREYYPMKDQDMVNYLAPIKQTWS